MKIKGEPEETVVRISRPGESLNRDIGLTFLFIENSSRAGFNSEVSILFYGRPGRDSPGELQGTRGFQTIRSQSNKISERSDAAGETWQIYELWPVYRNNETNY